MNWWKILTGPYRRWRLLRQAKFVDQWLKDRHLMAVRLRYVGTTAYI